LGIPFPGEGRKEEVVGKLLKGFGDPGIGWEEWVGKKLGLGTGIISLTFPRGFWIKGKFRKD